MAIKGRDFREEGATDDPTGKEGPIKVGIITNNLVSLEKRVNTLHARLDTLQDRLSTVMTKATQGEGAAADEKDVAAECTVAIRLGSLVDSVSDAIGQVEGMLKRIQL